MKNKNIFRRIFALCLAVTLWVTMFSAVSVNATDTATTINFGNVKCATGHEVTVPVVIENNTGLATFRFRVTYNTAAMEFLSVTESDAFAGGTLVSATNADEQTVTFLWYSLTNVAVDGEIVNLKFKINEGYFGVFPLEVAYKPTEILDQDRQMLDAAVTDGSITSMGIFSGNVDAYNKPMTNATVTLLKDGVEQYSAAVTDGSFKIECVTPDTYTVQVSAPKYKTQSYELVMDYANAHKDFDLMMMGDTNNDGNVNGRDYAIIMQYLNRWYVDIILDVADVNKDGRINGRDYALMMQYINGWNVKIY